MDREEKLGRLLPPEFTVADALELLRARPDVALLVDLPDAPFLLDLALDLIDPTTQLGALDGPPVVITDYLPDSSCRFVPLDLAALKQLYEKSSPLVDPSAGVAPEFEALSAKDLLRLYHELRADQLEAYRDTDAEDPANAKRVVNVAVRPEDDPDGHLPPTYSLAVDAAYVLEVSIGARRMESWLPADAEPLPEPPLPIEGADLMVTVCSRGDVLDFPAATRTLHLPQTGDSAVVPFTFSAKQTAQNVPVWVHVYYRWALLQTIELRLSIDYTEDDMGLARPAKVQYSRSNDFTNLESQRPSNVTLRLWKDAEVYRLAVAWPGDGTAANARRDPERGLNLTLPINAAALADAIVAARNTLYDITWQDSYRKSVAGNPIERKESIYKLAVVGNRLFALLFAPEAATAAQAESLQALRAWLDDVLSLPAEQGAPRVQVVYQGPPAGVPWNLLYPDPINDKNALRPERFWGCCYDLEIMTEQIAQNVQQLPEPRTPLKIGGGLYNFRVQLDGVMHEITSEHKQALETWDAASERVVLDLRDKASQQSLVELLSDSDVVYMFCHGHTAKSPTDTVEWTQRFREHFAQLDPDTQALYADLLKPKQATGADPNEDDSWLRWTKTLLPLRLLAQWLEPLPRKPVVLLNMCESAQVLPTLNTGFIPFFSRIGARGVLGTECPMLAPFAAAFGTELLQRIGDGAQIGAVLPELRLRFITQASNPLGLAYTYYGVADTAF